MNRTQQVSLATILSLVAFMAGDYSDLTFDESFEYYACEAEDTIRVCLNVNAGDTRCYYDPDNGRRYDYCAAGWTLFDIVPEESVSLPSRVVSSTTYASDRRFQCDLDPDAIEYSTCRTSAGNVRYLGTILTEESS